MIRKLPADAFAYYLGSGVGRCYRDVARHFGVSKTAVANRAAKERWPERLAEIERKASEASANRMQESLAKMNERHLLSLRAIQKRAIEALLALPMQNSVEAAKVLDIAIRHERSIRAEIDGRPAPEGQASVNIANVIAIQMNGETPPAAAE